MTAAAARPRSATSPGRRHGPLTRALVAILVFLGVGALGGGAAMVAAPGGDLIGMDPVWLAGVPLVDDWLVPGVWLLSLGTASSATAWAVVQRRRWTWARRIEQVTGQDAAWAIAQVIGVALVVFIGYEATVITAPEGRWMQVLMGAVGLSLCLLPRTASVRRDLRAG